MRAPAAPWVRAARGGSWGWDLGKEHNMATNRNGNFAEGRVGDRGRERHRPRGEVGRVFRQAFAVRNSAQAAIVGAG